MRWSVAMKSGDRLGHWTLLERIDRGGNAEVWEANNDDGGKAAIKVLGKQRPESEPYLRFRQEFEHQVGLAGDGAVGVLPIIEGMVPKSPTKASPAWFAMPVAEPLRHALGANPSVDEVLAAIADLADVLEELHARGIGHRDVKPENLFRLADRW